MTDLPQDAAGEVRPGEQIDLKKLNAFLEESGPTFEPILHIRQFPGGYSNLTYLLQGVESSWVLRRPPFGAEHIKGGHDMGREFRILSALYEIGYHKVPKPLVFTEDKSVMGSPFYIMERVEGLVLRAAHTAHIAKALSPVTMQTLSEALCDNLVALHAIDIQSTGLIHIGKPEGYVQRQLNGWYKRYQAAQTDNIPEMDALADWLHRELPPEQAPTLLHNDYKYDNLVLDSGQPTRIKAVLDWEMATVGDPLMDLGTCLSYWAEPEDGELEKSFNISWLPGNLSRKAFADRYALQSGRDLGKILFYYVFGLFKNAVVLQQIYFRYQKGLTSDQRFAGLLHGVRALAVKAVRAVDSDRI